MAREAVTAISVDEMALQSNYELLAKFFEGKEKEKSLKKEEIDICLRILKDTLDISNRVQQQQSQPTEFELQPTKDEELIKDNSIAFSHGTKDVSTESRHTNVFARTRAFRQRSRLLGLKKPPMPTAVKKEENNVPSLAEATPMARKQTTFSMDDLGFVATPKASTKAAQLILDALSAQKQKPNQSSNALITEKIIVAPPAAIVPGHIHTPSIPNAFLKKRQKLAQAIEPLKRFQEKPQILPTASTLKFDEQSTPQLPIMESITKQTMPAKQDVIMVKANDDDGGDNEVFVKLPNSKIQAPIETISASVITTPIQKSALPNESEFIFDLTIEPLSQEMLNFIKSQTLPSYSFD